VLILVPGGGPPRGGQERLVLLVPGLGPGTWHLDGRPALSSWPTARRGRRAARRSIIETATRNAAGGTAATTRLQAVGRAWARLAARLSSTRPASTTAGHDSRRVMTPEWQQPECDAEAGSG
jgi:hypothetical protein